MLPKCLCAFGTNECTPRYLAMFPFVVTLISNAHGNFDLQGN
jgi:hypothetical protein